MPFKHGVQVIEVTEGSRPIRTVATSVIGIVATSDDADATTFPENQAVLVTDIQSAIAKAGTTGTLAATLTAIGTQTNPVMVVVRVAEDADPAAQDTAVIGADAAGARSGLQALLTAETNLGVKPRIIGCPGLDTVAVATELASIAGKLRAMAYVAAAGATTKEEAVTYRGNFAQREVMVIWPSFTNHEATAIALGLRSRIDAEQGWHKSLSNVGIASVTGIDADVSFELNSTAHDAHYLNENDVTTIIRKDGFRFWGNRTCSDDPVFAFETQTRTAQIIADTISEAHLWAVDKPLTPTLAKDILEGINSKLRSLVQAGQIIGANAWLDQASNTVSQLQSGELLIDYDFTAVPPLESLTLNQRATGQYLIDFAA